MKTPIHLFLLAVLLTASVHTAAQDNKDWGRLSRYERSNRELMEAPNNGKRVVFLGNSITERWAKMHPEFFSENNYIGRGIGGQTSYQFLVRFRQDVINLKPAVVVINAATNDIAENTGPYNEDYTFGNIVSMVELARANKIKVILTTTLPAAAFRWNQRIKDAPAKITSLNARLQAYAKKQKIPFVDYYSHMVTGEDGALIPEYTNDGVHPISAGYDVMEPLVQKAIRKVLK